MNSAPETALLETRSLEVTIANHLVCRDLNLAINKGDRWGILGVNGVGKTTLLHTLAGLHTPQQGTIYYDGKIINELSNRQCAQHRGILFQDMSDPFPATVLESVLIGRHPYIDQWQWESSKDIKIARQTIKQVELQDRESQLVNTLSGGERQRVAIATLLSQQTKLLLLDEPINHLDLKRQMEVMEILSQLVEREKLASMMILHDLNIAARFCDKILMLFGDGRSTQGDSSELLNSELLNELYGYPIEKISHTSGSVFVPN